MSTLLTSPAPAQRATKADDSPSSRPAANTAPLHVACKLTVGAINDPMEAEADAMANKVMNTPFIQRKENGGNATVSETASRQIHASSGKGQSMDGHTQSFMESRFNTDFSQVRIHTDHESAQMNRDLHAQAFTVGNDIYFNSGKYDPQSDSGKRLLAHELTHTIQQGGSTSLIQRFADDDHHVVDEAAAAGIFSEEQQRNVEKGNTRRDYSQSPLPILNALFLGQYNLFGGYKDYEHFDNFIWDKEKERWISRVDWDKTWDDYSKQWAPKPTAVPRIGPPKKTPLQFIEGELLAAVQETPPSAAGFERIGNAFHTMEDFFAHSNFLELTQGDYSAGHELFTGSVEPGDNTAINSILSNVTSGSVSEQYHEKFLAGQATLPATAHARIAKDYTSNKNHELAMVLAALVVNETAKSLKDIFQIKDKDARMAAVGEIMQKLSRYFRPPSDKDKWWETLLQGGGKAMREKIRDIRNRTIVTQNQWDFSPLRGLEANRLGDVRALGALSVLPGIVGLALHAPGAGLPIPSLSVPVGSGNKSFLTLGGMFLLPGVNDFANQPFIDTHQARLLSDMPRPVQQEKPLGFTGASFETRF
ncbi:eCIS core domain-containing protein [Chitinophaga vietnamensis]|uniref:eCIS core domain-containing protein n=1 Tax=Chitinophaga vietnamensis TaxID=2593957 RepID=UPI0011781125|nr:DUF4157 domain-containing protein [Chitinophaga vietnamensis]